MSAPYGRRRPCQAAGRGLSSARWIDPFIILMVWVMPFNGVLNRLERYVLRWRPRERAAARELQ